MNRKRYNVSCETLFLPFKVVLVITLLLAYVTPTLQAIDTVTGLTTENYLIVDYDSEMILSGENYDKQKGIASVTKVMSYVVYMEKIEADGLDPKETVIPISDEIVDNFARDRGLSGVYFNYGSKYTLEELLDLMMVYSDNGATIAIGEYLFGKEETAVELMNAKAKELGLKDTIYYNTTGLTMVDYKDAMLEGTNPKDYNASTAREQAILGKYVITEYPQVLDLVGQSFIKFENSRLANFNLMLPDLDYDYPGVEGLKTGSSIEAGYCFVGYYIDPVTEKAYISVVLDSENAMKRFNDTTYLYNWLGDTEMHTLIEKDQELELKVKGAKSSTYITKTNSDYQIPYAENINLERRSFEFNPKYFDENNKLVADIPLGGIVGSYVYTLAEDDSKENVFQSLESDENIIKIQVVSTEEIKQEGFIGSIITGITDFFVNVFESI